MEMDFMNFNMQDFSSNKKRNFFTPDKITNENYNSIIIRENSPFRYYDKTPSPQRNRFKIKEKKMRIIEYNKPDYNYYRGDYEEASFEQLSLKQNDISINMGRFEDNKNRIKMQYNIVQINKRNNVTPDHYIKKSKNSFLKEELTRIEKINKAQKETIAYLQNQLNYFKEQNNINSKKVFKLERAINK